MVEAVQNVAAVVETLKSKAEMQSMSLEMDEVNNIVVYIFNGLENWNDEFMQECVVIKIAMINLNKFEKLRSLVEQIKEQTQQLIQGQANVDEFRDWMESILDDIEEAQFVMSGIASTF